jgi:hypothetical protein
MRTEKKVHISWVFAAFIFGISVGLLIAIQLNNLIN